MRGIFADKALSEQIYMSRVMRKPAFCISADQGLRFHYMDSTIPLSKSKISSLLPSSTVVQPGLCLTWS